MDGEQTNACGSCKHFIGGGDWNLCCDIKYDLCSAGTRACDDYEFSQETVDKVIAQTKWLEEYLRKNVYRKRDER